MKKILILSDLPDLVRFQRVDHLMVRQLYVLVYLLGHFTRDWDTTLQFNDRSRLSYEGLWADQSDLKGFLSPYLTHLEWKEISFEDYALIVCHYDYEMDLYHHLFDRYGCHFDERKIYSLVNPRMLGGPSLFFSVQKLFAEDGLFKVDDHFKGGVLADFKKGLTTHFRECRKVEQEKLFASLLGQLLEVNRTHKHKPYKRVLVLDDYRRDLFIGDSTVWLSLLRRAIRYCDPCENVVVNCNNLKAHSRLKELYEHAFDTEVTISSQRWEDIAFHQFDLILLETDLVLKFLNHIYPSYCSQWGHTSVYTITPAKERSSDRGLDWDFFSHHRECSTRALPEDENFSPDKEIYIGDSERNAAAQWLLSKGGQEGVVIVFNDSAKQKKVLRPEEFVMLVCRLIQKTELKVLLFEGGNREVRRLLQSLLDKEEWDRVIFSEYQGIRHDMALCSSRYTKAIIGPCTGMMHLANGMYTYLFNHAKISREDIPFMLVYTGKQEHDIDYLPHNWWTHTLVGCAVVVRDGESHRLVDFRQLPVSTKAFYADADEVSSITGEELFQFFYSSFSRLHIQLKL